MKRTRKWAFVSQEAARLAALGLKPSEIAARLGLNKSTVTRWMAAGKLERHEKPAAGSPRVLEGTVWRDQTPAEWAAAVREDYDLSVTDDQLVTLAQNSLVMSRDATVSANLRMTATRTFQGLVRQIGLETRSVVDVPDVTPKPEAPEEPISRPATPLFRKPGTDPRFLLQ